MPSLPNIGGYGGGYQTIDLNVKNIDVVNCDADLVSTAVLVLNGNTVDIPVIEADIVAAEANITTLQGEMITANADIYTLQGEMITANADISTLQGEMITANADIVAAEGNITTLQGEMITANADISTLQGEMITANADISTLEGQMITANAGILALQGEIVTADADILTLQTKTQNQTAVAYETTFTGAATVTGIFTPSVTAAKFGTYTKNTTTAFTTSGTQYDLAYTTLSYSTGSLPLTNASGVFTSTASSRITCMCTVLLTWPANATGYRTMQVVTSSTNPLNLPFNTTLGGPYNVPGYATLVYTQEWHFTVSLGVGGNFKVQGSQGSGGTLTAAAHATTTPFSIQVVVL